MQSDINFKQLSYETKLALIIFAISLVYLLISTYLGIFKANFWYDELYSINMAVIPFDDMMTRGIYNVHPLLYYFILRIFTEVFTYFNILSVPQTSVLVSLIPYYLLFILSLTKIRKNFGLLTASLFALCLISMPQLLRFSIEVRMYGWALFFITASFVYMYDITKQSNFKNWAILSILTICSAYTHYFSAVASFCMYLLFFIYVICKKRELLRNFICSAVICVLAYAPWIPALQIQMHGVEKGFWIDPITFHTVINYIYYVFNPFNSYINEDAILQPDLIGTILIICVLFAFYTYLKNSHKNYGNYPFYGLVAVLLVPIIGITISILYRPIFFMRYLVPILGILWLSFCICLKNMENKKHFKAIVLIVLLAGLLNMAFFINTEITNYNAEQEFIENTYSIIPEGSIIIHTMNKNYLQRNIMDNNYTDVSVENLTHPSAPRKLWRNYTQEYMEKILQKDEIKNRNPNVKIYLTDTFTSAKINETNYTSQYLGRNLNTTYYRVYLD